MKLNEVWKIGIEWQGVIVLEILIPTCLEVKLCFMHRNGIQVKLISIKYE